MRGEDVEGGYVKILEDELGLGVFELGSRKYMRQYSTCG